MAKRVGLVAGILGAALVLTTTLGVGGVGALGFALLALAPYVALVLLSRRVTDPWIIGGAGVAALAVEVGIRAAVFLFPRGSTASIALVFSPAFISFVGLPTGAAAGFALEKAWQRGGLAIRSIAVLLAVTALALLVLDIARPDLFPTTVLRRRTLVSRIGPPRIVKGGDAFDVSVVTRDHSWFFAGRFDDGPDDQIVVAAFEDAQLLDSNDFHVRRRVAFGPRMRGLWNWYSMVVRVGDRLAVAQTGGGYSDTELRSLDGELMWSYRPDPDLPPSAMKPADLDGDGRVEFYGSDAKGIVRLDGDGREVWRRPAPMYQIVAVAPAVGDLPAWIVGARYQTHVSVWTANGDHLADPGGAEAASVVGIVEWRGSRALALAGTTARGIGLDGRLLFEIPMGDFALSSAMSVRFAPGALPWLALTGAAPRGVDRWRLILVSPSDEIVFDEILGAPVTLLKALRPDGSDVLLISGDGLRALSRRR